MPAYPEDKVPTLPIDGQPLTEVAAILVLSRPAVSPGRRTLAAEAAVGHELPA